jgi:hypothetical protein
MVKRANKPAEFKDSRTTNATVEQSGIERPTVGDSKPTNGAEEPQGRNETATGFSTVSPIDLAAGAGSGGSNGADPGTTPKRRGRIPGSRNKETKAASDLITDLTGAICGFNSVLAALTHVPEFEVSKDQAEVLSESVKNFAQHFSVKLDPVKLAGFQLFMTASVVYGPGIAAFYRRSTRVQSLRTELNNLKESVVEMPKSAPVPSTANRNVDLGRKVAEVPSQVWDGAPEDDLSLGTQ